MNDIILCSCGVIRNLSKKEKNLKLFYSIVIYEYILHITDVCVCHLNLRKKNIFFYFDVGSQTNKSNFFLFLSIFFRFQFVLVFVFYFVRYRMASLDKVRIIVVGDSGKIQFIFPIFK